MTARASAEGSRLGFVLALFLGFEGATAQHPVLAPTSDTTIVVSGSVLHYSSIHVPAGVTVRFVIAFAWPIPFFPTIIACDGDAIVHGTMTVAGDTLNGFGYPAGWVTTGEGVPGWLCGSPPNAVYIPPTGGLHAGTYGSVVPFSLEGGSSGGYLDEYGPGCWPYLKTSYGGGGGGTLVLHAHGRIEIAGTVTADGYHPNAVKLQEVRSRARSPRLTCRSLVASERAIRSTAC